MKKRGRFIVRWGIFAEYHLSILGAISRANDLVNSDGHLVAVVESDRDKYDPGSRWPHIGTTRYYTKLAPGWARKLIEETT